MLAQYELNEMVGGIIGSCVFGYIAINFFVGLFSPDAKPLSDRFELGYIDDNDSNDKVEVAIEEKDELQELRRQVEIAKLKKQLSELEEPSFDKALFNDCVDALTGLGTPARKAKAEAQTIFEKNPNIKTVQEFITEYGKR
jgi:hypothetical protein|tara:strand:+ start:329 stop:751 length:423 start_codon:yes stop_codon:yes gene_type:complete